MNRSLSRVVLVIGQLGLGGTERQLVLLATGLCAAGVDVHVIALWEGGPREADLAAAGVPVWHARLPRRGAQLVAMPGRLLDIVRWLREIRPDVLHAFLFHSYVLMAPLALLARVPVRVAGRRSLGNFKADRRAMRFAEKLANRGYQAFVANSHAVAADAIAQEHLDPATVSVIPNALPPEAFEQTAAAPLECRHPRLVCVANLIDYKGHRFLVEALGLLAVRGLAPVLVLVGDGPERDSLARRTAELDVDVEFLGARRDIAALLAACDVFVLPSLEEGMSNALMEALAAGLPVVCTDVGGNREVVGDAAIVCRPRSAEDLADALAEVLTDGEKALKLGDAGRRRAQEAFGIDTMVRRHLELYADLLARAPEGKS